jgi:hypothetical protein
VLAVNLCNQQRKNCERLVAVGDTSFVKFNDKDPEDKNVYVEQYSFIHVRAVFNLSADFSRFHALIIQHYTTHKL